MRVHVNFYIRIYIYSNTSHKASAPAILSRPSQAAAPAKEIIAATTRASENIFRSIHYS